MANNNNMNFTIDKQSLEELNLLGKFRQGSIYSIFKQVKSSSGERLLDNLFKTPLADDNMINERSELFKFFQEAAIAFPFDAAQLGVMTDYVEGAAGSSALSNYFGVLSKLVLSRIARDERYKSLIQGLQATITVLKKCYGLLAELSAMGNIPAAYALQLTGLREIFSDRRMVQLIETDIYKPMTARNIASYDHLIKGGLRPSVTLILEFIAEVDVFIAVSGVARNKRFGWAKAQPKTANFFKASELRHPSIDGGVGNHIEMSKGSNVVFLTGANMAGKSTLMKSIGINLYLAHIGFPVAALNMEFSVREGIYSSINVADNIGMGYSHFYAEVVRVKEAADATATGKYLLLMFDELFKGTNVKDAYDGTLAVTEAFAEYANCLFIVSTHIIEVGEALKKQNNIQFRYMPTVMQGAIPHYTYKLEEGITEDRQGMMIIRNERILELMGAKQ